MLKFMASLLHREVKILPARIERFMKSMNKGFGFGFDKEEENQNNATALVSTF